jgi:CRISPR-associated protein Cas5h
LKVLVFDIYGDFAHFRKFYTTSSPLTFPFPPPPTVRGIIGAILGFEREEYLEKTKDLLIGVGILSPVKKIRMGLNYIHTKGKSGFDPTLILSRKQGNSVRTQVRAEFVKDAKYRIYVSGEGKVFENLKRMVENHETYYTVYLGKSELLADFDYVGLYDGEYQEELDRVDSVVPVEVVKNISVKENQILAKELVPTLMDIDRTVKKYEEVIFDLNGKSIYGKFKKLVKTSEDKFIYLW